MQIADNISRLPALPKGFTPPHILSGYRDDAPILIALSGGADSTALLHILSIYAKSTGAPLYAAHVNHCIRGAEADRDQQFCQELADSLGVKLFVLRADVPKIASETGESIETAARRIRYEYFDTLMGENNIKTLATAHNADDNLETVIFNIARGAGLGGICGIPDCRPCKHGSVVRPILNMEKSEILQWCNSHSLSFVTDSTNTDTDYTRNRIRAEIIPVMRQINSGAVKNAARMSRSLREDSLCLESMAGWFVEELGSRYEIDVEKLCGSPASVVNRALIRLYDEFSGGKTLEQTHINALKQLAKRAIPHSCVSLPNNVVGIIEDSKLRLVRKETLGISYDDYLTPLTEGENNISQTNSKIFIGSSQSSKNIYKNSILLYLDSAKICGELTARPRKSGDRILMGGMHKSLKKLMCDKKIPLEMRPRIPVICDNDGIIAVPHIGVADKVRMPHRSDNDPSVLEIIFYFE